MEANKKGIALTSKCINDVIKALEEASTRLAELEVMKAEGTLVRA